MSLWRKSKVSLLEDIFDVLHGWLINEPLILCHGVMYPYISVETSKKIPFLDQPEKRPDSVSNLLYF